MSGFTLIEMAMVMIIAGIILSTIMSVMPSIIKSAKVKETRALLDKYDHALVGYAIANSRLPWADLYSDSDGKEDTHVYFGYLPYKTLGLAAGDDGWGHKIKYAVYGKSGEDDKKNLTFHFAATDTDETPSVHKTARENFQDALKPVGTETDTTKVYTIFVDVNGNKETSPNQAYVIASGGAKDLDGNNDFFDLYNGKKEASNHAFNADNQLQSATYDDLVRSKAAMTLIGEIN